jgi:hypothetical protein
MSESILQKLIDKFCQNPRSMNCGASKLAKRNNTTEDIVRQAKKIAKEKSGENTTPVINIKESFVSFDNNEKTGSGILDYRGSIEIKTKEDLVKECNIDLEEWDIDRMTHSAWGKAGNQSFQVKAFLSKKKVAQNFQESFKEFLNSYEPKIEEKESKNISNNKPKGCLIINKQDAHLNKHDVDGDNDISQRFDKTWKTVDTVLQQASLSNNIEKLIYIVGSDQFNSEWTMATTRGTPQENISSYQKSFQLICDHELEMVTLLLQYCQNVEIKYIPGNHDEYVGWHLINWLKAVYKHNSMITIDDSNDYTKYVKYSNTGMMFNHGDAIKPVKLAGMFPVEFKKYWSSCDNFYIFTGDKHHEKSEDYNGIIFYQLPALSSSKSLWDKKNGYTTSKAELTAFLIEENKGRTLIFKQPLD